MKWNFSSVSQKAEQTVPMVDYSIKILYHTMMRSSVIIGLLLMGIVAPQDASAYIPPEDLLNNQDFSLRFLEAPPSRRSIRDVIDEQAERSAQRRAAAFEAEYESQHPAAPEDPSADNQEATESPTQLDAILDAIDRLKNEEEGTTENVTDEDIRNARILQRIEANQKRGGDYGNESLHSGAPLTDTGPATTVAVTGLLAAALWTLKRASKTHAVR